MHHALNARTKMSLTGI